MPSDNCRKLGPRLAAYMDGEMPGTERGELERHLASCPGCAGALKEMREAERQLGSLQDIEPPPFFAARVAAAARALDEYHGPFRRFLRFPLPAAAALTAFILFNVISFGTSISAMEPGLRRDIAGKVMAQMARPDSLLNPVAVAKLCGDCSVYLCGCMRGAGKDRICRCGSCDTHSHGGEAREGEHNVH